MENEALRYLYTPRSKVFHTCNCRLLKGAARLEGVQTYAEAEKLRRPCKVCKPVPDWTEELEGYLGPKEQPVPQETSEKRVIHAKLLGNHRVPVLNTHIVGCCHNKLHPGKLTRKLMEQHDCLGKECRFFQKYEERPYWVEQKRLKQKKEDARAKKRQQKEREAQAMEEMESLKELFQSYADDAGYQMLIVRIQQERPGKFTVFYVSENRFADGNRFPSFLETIKFYYPYYRINLRHIKDVDGHFVTIEEFNCRRK